MSTLNMPSPLRLALLCLIIVCSACANPEPPLPRLAPEAVILAFGDSLTFGTGADSAESYPAVLAVLTGRRVLNAGVPGEVSAAGAQRLNEIMDREQPQLLLLCHGGNDLLRKLDSRKTMRHLRHMITAARAREIPVVLIGVPEPKLFNRRSAPYYASIAEEFAIPLENDILAHIVSDTDLKSDGVHPNAEGYRQLAQAVFALLQRTGAL